MLENKIDNKENMLGDHDQNIQQIWDNIKRSNIRIIGIEEGTEIQTSDINLRNSHFFNEIISENFPNLMNEMDIHLNTMGTLDSK